MKRLKRVALGTISHMPIILLWAYIGASSMKMFGWWLSLPCIMFAGFLVPVYLSSWLLDVKANSIVGCACNTIVFSAAILSEFTAGHELLIGTGVMSIFATAMSYLPVYYAYKIADVPEG